MTAILLYALSLIVFDYINRKTTWFHPVGWAGIALLLPALILACL